MRLHIFRGYTATDTPGYLADTTGYLPGAYDEQRAQAEMKRLPTQPCPMCRGVGWRPVDTQPCPRCNGFGLVIVGRKSITQVLREVP